MKQKVFILVLIAVSSFILMTCSVNEPPDIRDISGIWKISVGNEYSLNVKYLTINVTNSSIIYNDIVLDDNIIEGNKLHAAKHFTADTSFYVNLTLTYRENHLVGHEYWARAGELDSVYIFGEKIAPLPVEILPIE